MKGLVLTPVDSKVHLKELPTPHPGPGEVLIRVSAVALNPIDHLYVDFPIAEQDERVIGTDFAGVVVGGHSDLEGSQDPRSKTGARVAGFLQGACSTNDRPGAFAEYITAAHDLIWEVPENVTLEAAATVSMCGLTAAQGVFYRLGLPCPFTDSAKTESQNKKDPINVLVYGSSTSLGLYAAQLVHHSAKFSGRKIRLIGAASASNHGFLREAPYLYDHLVDYRSSDWVKQIGEATGGKGVDYALDCISENNTVPDIESTLNPDAKFAVFRGPKGGKYDPTQLQVKPIYGAVWEGLGAEIGYNGAIIPASPAAQDFAVKFFSFLSSAVEGGLKLEPNTVRLMPGGLERLPTDGLSVIRGDKHVGPEEHLKPISAEKLVYRVRA